MNKKILIPVVLVLVVAAVGGKMFLLPKKAQAKPKVNGTIYVLPKQFTLNLADGKYATLTLALLLKPGQSDGASADGATTTPAGFGTLTQEPVIRSIVTSDVTSEPSSVLLTNAGRVKLQKEILKGISKETDVKVSKVYFTDLAVQ